METFREDVIQNAIKFLSNPNVKGTSIEQRRSFLRGKGLSNEEVEESFRRIVDLFPHASSATEGKPSVQHVPSTALIVARNPSRFLWSQLAWTVSIFLVACTGTGLLFKRLLLRRIKQWIRGVVLKDDSVGKMPIEASAIQGINAVKLASSAAVEVARANKEIMKVHSQETHHFNNIVQALEIHTVELSKVMIAMKNIITDSSNKKQLLTTKVQSNGNWKNSDDLAPGQKLSGNPTGATRSRDQLPEESQSKKPDHAPHSASYLEVLAILERGEKPPGILEINDKPPNPHRPPSMSRLQPRPKPWEIVKVEKNEYVAGKGSFNKVANTSEQLIGAYSDLTQEKGPMHISPFDGRDEKRIPTSTSPSWRHKTDTLFSRGFTHSENTSYDDSSHEKTEDMSEQKAIVATIMKEPVLLSEMPLIDNSEAATGYFKENVSIETSSITNDRLTSQSAVGLNLASANQSKDIEEVVPEPIYKNELSLEGRQHSPEVVLDNESNCTNEDVSIQDTDMILYSESVTSSIPFEEKFSSVEDVVTESIREHEK